MKQHLALFDLDGTLFDTRMVNYRSYNEAFSQFGCSIDYETFARDCNGRHYKVFAPAILGGTEHLEEVHRMKKAYYPENLHSATENKPLFALIEAIRPTYFTAVVTTASRENTMQILRHFNREDMFDLILTQEDVTRKKPDPEGFLKAMEYFRISPDHTIIFEDSDVGLAAAGASGAAVYAVKGYA